MIESPNSLSVALLFAGIIVAIGIFLGFRVVALAIRKRSANSALELYVSTRANHANGPVAEVYAKIRKGEALSPGEEARRRLAFQQQLNLYDLICMHYRYGQIDESIWQGIQYRIQKILADDWSRTQWYDGIKGSVSNELKSLIETNEPRDA